MKSFKNYIQNFSKVFIKRKRPYQYEFPESPFKIQNSKKSHTVIKNQFKSPVDGMNVNALMLLIRIRFCSMRRDINLLLFTFRTNFPIKRPNYRKKQ